MKTTEKSLGDLMDALADELNDQIVNGKTVIDKETGDTKRVSTDASTLNVARQLLKDQGIEVQAGTNDALNQLANSLPFEVVEGGKEETG